MDAAIEHSAMRKIFVHLLPLAVLSYFLAYIDRINVSFAGLALIASVVCALCPAYPGSGGTRPRADAG